MLYSKQTHLHCQTWSVSLCKVCQPTSGGTERRPRVSPPPRRRPPTTPGDHVAIALHSSRKKLTHTRCRRQRGVSSSTSSSNRDESALILAVVGCCYCGCSTTTFSSTNKSSLQYKGLSSATPEATSPLPQPFLLSPAAACMASTSSLYTHICMVIDMFPYLSTLCPSSATTCACLPATPLHTFPNQAADICKWTTLRPREQRSTPKAALKPDWPIFILEHILANESTLFRIRMF